MRTAVKALTTIASMAIVLPVVALNVETVAIKHGWDAMLSNLLEGRADWLLAFAMHKWTVFSAFGLMGLLAGVWLDSFAKSWDAKGPTKSGALLELRIGFDSLMSELRGLGRQWDGVWSDPSKEVVPLSLRSEANALFLRARAIKLDTPNVEALEGRTYLVTVANYVQQITPLLSQSLIAEAKKLSRKIAKDTFQIGKDFN